MDSSSLSPEFGRREKGFWAAEPLVPDGDDLAMSKLVAFLEIFLGFAEFLIKIQCDVAKLLLDLPGDLALSLSSQGVAAVSQEFHHVLCERTPRNVRPHDGM